MKMNHMVIAFAASVATITLPVQAVDYPSMNLKMAHFVPATTAGAKWDQWWADQVEERSGGKVKVQIFWAGSMGKTDEMYQMVSDGVIDFAVFPATYKPRDLPLTSVGGAVPRLFPTANAAAEQTQALYKLKGVQAEWAAEGLEPLFSHSSNPYQIQCNKPIRTMEDLRGTKIRSAGDYHPRVWEAVGAVPIAVPLGEVYQSLQYGNIHCGWMTVDNAFASKTYEVAKYAIDINTGSLATWQIYVNRDNFYGKWPEAVRDLMREISAEAISKELAALQTAAEKAKQGLRDKGVEFISFEDKDAFEAQLPDLLGAWADDLRKEGKGDSAEAVVETIRSGPLM
tara:strand:- start:5268 stop:6290 length:1023 start_codon:yes stop_codon:yes gene_type:complete